MSTSTTHRIDVRSTNCMRHRVWMASCDDCRSAHAPKSRDEKATAR